MLRHLFLYKRTLSKLEQGHLILGALCCIIREIKETIMDYKPYDADKFADEERKQRSDILLARYNDFYNLECSGLPHGTPITPEFQQAMTLECVLDTLRCENLNHEFDMVLTADINDLIEALYQQGKDYLQRVKEFKDSAEGVA